ncbi:MAG TPA: DUF1295 domain-containing protein [Oscillatoriaceae cyanobacterium]
MNATLLAALPNSAVAAVSAAALALALFVLWLLSLKLRDASIVDIFWGAGFVMVAIIGCALGGGAAPRRWLVLALVAVWGLRLAGYLYWRNHGRGEDKRYTAMREERGDSFPLWSLFAVFGLQGALIWLVSLPVQVAQSLASPTGLTWLDGLGAGVVMLGVLCEALGDYQLARFKANPANRGHVLNHGLWRYTRHPNYFGDFCVWWGLYLIAAATGAGAWTIVSPLVMSWVLIRVSGVALTERQMAGRPGYAEYVQRTSAFVPLPPRPRRDLQK